MKSIPAISPKISPKARLLELLDEEHFKRTLKGIEKCLAREIPGSRAFEKLSRWARRVQKGLRDAEVYNLRYILKWAMLARPRWRRQVLEDLGGEAALQDWEDRQIRADVRAKQPVNYEVEPGNVSAAHPSKTRSCSVKTDRSGHFRLAPVVKPKWRVDLLASSASQPQTVSRISAWDTEAEPETGLPALAKQKPIPLLPDELRGDDIPVELEIAPDSDPAFEQRLETYGNPPKVRRLPYKPLAPIDKPNQAWSFAMASLPEEAIRNHKPP